MRFYTNFLVEEAEQMNAAKAVRRLRQEFPHWPQGIRERWPSCLAEPFRCIPLEPEYDWALPLTHVWSEKWSAPIYFLICPMCGRRVRNLLRLCDADAWACRQCHRVKYVSQLTSESAVARGHLAARALLEWHLSQPGPKPRSVQRLQRKVERTAWALESPSGQWVRRRWKEETACEN